MKTELGICLYCIVIVYKGGFFFVWELPIVGGIIIDMSMESR